MYKDVRQEAQCEGAPPLARPRNCDIQKESSKSYAVNIEQMENGFFVEVGCKKFVFPDISDLLEAIDLYYSDYETAKKKYLTK
jgi:hypothetical protein